MAETLSRVKLDREYVDYVRQQIEAGQSLQNPEVYFAQRYGLTWAEYEALPDHASPATPPAGGREIAALRERVAGAAEFEVGDQVRVVAASREGKIIGLDHDMYLVRFDNGAEFRYPIDHLSPVVDPRDAKVAAFEAALTDAERQREAAMTALREIAEMDGDPDDEGLVDEWTEARAFQVARNRAAAALDRADGEAR